MLVTARVSIDSRFQSTQESEGLNLAYFPHSYPQSYLQVFQQTYPQYSDLIYINFLHSIPGYQRIYPQQNSLE